MRNVQTLVLIQNILLFSGIITAVSMFDSSARGVFIGLLMLFVAICFLLAAGGDLLLLTKVYIQTFNVHMYI